MKEIISTNQAPQAIGPYSQAVKIDGWLFCSGQIALRADGTMVENDITKQTEQVMLNLKAVLETAGADFSQVVKTTIYLTDLNNFQKVNEIYGRYFSQNPPARATVQVAALPKESLVEIEIIAKIS